MAIKKVNDTSLSSVADAIRAKGGTVASLYFPDGFVDAIDAIPDTFESMVLLGTQATYENDTAINIPSYAFAESLVKNISMPNVSTVKYNAFYLSQAETVNLPNASSFQTSAFEGSQKLTTCTISDRANIPQKMFFDCRKLAGDFIFSDLSTTNVGGQAFMHAGCDNSDFLLSVSLPNVTTLGTQPFGAAKLKSISIPKVTAISDYAFANTKFPSDYSLIIPATVTALRTRCFQQLQCKKIVFEGQLPDLTGDPCFIQCSATEYDFSNSSRVPTMSNSDNFYRIPDESKMIVPDELYDEWIAATNWTVYADKIIKKSDYIGG